MYRVSEHWPAGLRRLDQIYIQVKQANAVSRVLADVTQLSLSAVDTVRGAQT